jgi:uncharacterized protein YcbX
MSSEIKVTDLFVFPVKSMRGMAVPRWRIDATGLELDRTWIVCDRSYKQVTLRELPKMALIDVKIEFNGGVDSYGVPLAFNSDISLYENGGTLILSGTAPDAPPDLRIPFPTPQSSSSVPLQCWDDTVWGIDEGDEAATWLSTYLRNLRVSPGGFRFCVKDKTNPVSRLSRL